MAFLTICTAPKPFKDAHICTIQWNAIRSWSELGSDVKVVLTGDEEGVEQAARELGVDYFPGVARNSQGTPVIPSMFDAAREKNTPLLACVNADILLFEDFLRAARGVAERFSDFLVVGQRWDLDIQKPLDFSTGWQNRLRQDLKIHGSLHPRGGSDYFIFPRHAFIGMPNLVVGRAGWDNWMIYAARSSGLAVVDATPEVTIIHQRHDYNHLPGGQPHYRHPETRENVRLGGGERTIFTLMDCSHEILNGRIRPMRLTWKKVWREVEIFPLVRLHSKILTQVFYALFHPVRAYRDFRSWLRKRKASTGKSDAQL